MSRRIKEALAILALLVGYTGFWWYKLGGFSFEITTLDVFYFLSGLAIGATIWAVVWGIPRQIRKAMPQARRWEVVFIHFWFVGVIVFAGAKTPIVRHHLAQFITVIRGGGIIDASGRVTDATVMAATANLASQLVEVTQAAVDVVNESQELFEDAEQQLSEFSGSVAYLAGDLPRALPNVWTNHNIAANIEHLVQDGTNVTAYVWFTQEPTIVPLVQLEYSVAENQWAWMTSVTNSYPETVLINDVPCVEYQFHIPKAVAGTPMRPNYELQFGTPYEPLLIPLGGVVVTDKNNVQHHGFTGTDHYSPDFSVTFDGGIAVSAMYYGTNYTGNVTL